MNAFVSGTDRQQQIVQLVEQRQRISITELCAMFDISEATARRDLENLAVMGKVQRVHGGAIALESSPPELPMLERSIEQNDEKVRIGRAVAGLIAEGETVFLGSGTTVLEVARALRERRSLTVITNSLPVVNTFAGLENINLVCLGGMLRNSELSFIGHITEQALAEIRADKVVIGTRAISLEHGLTHDYMPETLTDRAIMRAGSQVIVAADHSKFGRVAHILLAPISSVDTIVTDAGLSSELVESLQAAEIHLVLA